MELVKPSSSAEEQILNALLDLHGSYVKGTVLMKDPSELIDLLSRFSDMSIEIQDHLNGQPHSVSKELEPLFSLIESTKLSPEAKTNCLNWTVMIFETYPTVIDKSHFENLMKNAYVSADGDV